MEIQQKRRYEIKMVYENMQRFEAQAWVQANPAGFATAYPTRRVNSIYFDTPDFSTYQDHVAGVALRRKLRFRWYGQDLTRALGQIEVKHKQGDLGWKWLEPVEETLQLQGQTWWQLRSRLRLHADPRIQSLLDAASPVLMNSYQRDYYVSADGLIRVTLDYDLYAYQQMFTMTPNLSFRQPFLNLVVLEFKCDMDQSARLADILARFPLRVQAYSKYVEIVDGMVA